MRILISHLITYYNNYHYKDHYNIQHVWHGYVVNKGWQDITFKVQKHVFTFVYNVVTFFICWRNSIFHNLLAQINGISYPHALKFNFDT